MKNLRVFLTLFLLTAVSGLAAVQDAVQWNTSEYSDQFKYFREQQSPDRESWDALTPERQNQELENIKADSIKRHEQVVKYYDTAMEKWNISQMRDRLEAVKDQDIWAVHLWLGREQGSALERKISTLRSLTLKAERQGLDDKDLSALEPYLKPDALAGLKAYRLAADSVQKSGKAGKDKTGPERSRSGQELGKFAGTDPSRLSADKFSEFYDASASGKKFEEPYSGVKISAKKTAADAAPAEIQARKSLKTAPIPILTGPTLPVVSHGASNKNLTSDAYGITVHLSGRDSPLTFRKGDEADAAIRRLPDGSVTKIIFYGHSGPGLQGVDPQYAINSQGAAQLLKGKMSPGGVVQFTGCNTASIGGSTLNPAVGVSMVVRRLLYYSPQYFADRIKGVPAAQADQDAEKQWNLDLARDTSNNLRGAVVCGYRTFALPLGRLPILTTLLGNQEAVTPGYVAGKKACYRDGQEVPAQ